jgi:hypothetical protein
MTNEELALQVQAGDAAAYELLAGQNKGILHRQAWRLWCALAKENNVYGMEFADMEQLAMMASTVPLWPMIRQRGSCCWPTCGGKCCGPTVACTGDSAMIR